jgi:hypothetical protein
MYEVPCDVSNKNELNDHFKGNVTDKKMKELS